MDVFPLPGHSRCVDINFVPTSSVRLDVFRSCHYRCVKLNFARACSSGMDVFVSHAIPGVLVLIMRTPAV